MNARITFAVLAIAAGTMADVATADLITINVDPAGTTSNSTLYGTVLTDNTATWPSFNQDKTASRYRDYQFELLTASGSTTFDSFAVQLSASLRTNTGTSNSLRATLWSGPIVANPLLSNSLITVSTPNSAFTNGSSSYSSVLLTGSTFVPQTITTSPSTFFFRVWAEGAGQNNGYQTKMAANQTEFAAVTMSPAPAIDAFIEYDADNDGLIDDGEGDTVPGTRDLISEVPEPSTWALAAGGLVCAALGMARRRR
jgi:hypothetical protein